jgi:hypothetical protein
MEIKQPLTSEHSEQEMYEKNIFKYVLHIHTYTFYQPKKWFGCNRPDGNILQNTSRKWMPGFPVVNE